MSYGISVVDWSNPLTTARIVHEGLRHTVTLERGEMPTLQQIDEKIRSCAKYNYYCINPDDSHIVLINQTETTMTVEYRNG